MADAGSHGALFTVDGDTFVPSVLTTGPWRADAQHGGPPSALLGRAIELSCTDTDVIARLGIELVKPVPLLALTVATNRTQVSRRVTHIDSQLRHDGTVVARATALVLQAGDLPAPRWRPASQTREIPGPETRFAMRPFRTGDLAERTYHQHAVEHRLVGGDIGVPGPATSWVRLCQPLVAGEAVTPLQSLLAAADFGSGISSIYGPDDGVGLINADLSVALTRPPVGEWICLDATTHPNTVGTGLAVTMLSDQDGFVGVATQSLLGT